MKTTISVIKADVGSVAGHGLVHPALLAKCKEILAKAKDEELLIDYHVTNCGDDTELIMTHQQGEENEEVHNLAWNAFLEATEVAKKLKLYGAGHDLFFDTFLGNNGRIWPEIAEMEFKEGVSDPILIFTGKGIEPGAFNVPLFRMFANPFKTAEMILNPLFHAGFEFELYDVMEHKKITRIRPAKMHDLLELSYAINRYIIERVRRRHDKEITASVSTARLMAGGYAGKNSSIAILRLQQGFSTVNEAIEPFVSPYLISGWMKSSHNSLLMPILQKNAYPVKFDNPPRVMGFQIVGNKIVGPANIISNGRILRPVITKKEVIRWYPVAVATTNLLLSLMNIGTIKWT